ncbi:MAG: hypothetical protein ABIO57_01615 [Candidatus Paceibacterota bacterium]
MDDIEEVIKRADQLRFEDERIGILNPISSLPTSKEKIKKSLIERITMLIGAYVSLATFIPDELIDHSNKEIYLRILEDMKKLRMELNEKLN